ncbi:AMP-binding protein [Oceanispirochaeta sp.]|uniref:AMP-binding protein n=1 Tax=Oceanispirochaeta sp. TaxID=2035350 RepID=UPI00260F9787|nr:AMP-binding protein [Oceanispirochaeta sp.]MDA3956322.1 AMP-binding protein [Oceanispirochaeta sp.]
MPYDLNKYTLSEAWSKSRDQYKDLDFLGYAGDSMASFGQVAQNIRELQNYLVNQGVKRGEKVALVSESRPEWGQVYLAINTMGAVAVPIMADFSAEQMCNILDHSDSVFVIASDKVIPRLLGSSLVLADKLVLIQDGLKTGKLKTEGEEWSFTEESDLFNPASPTQEDHLYMVEEDDIAAILYTSGTTGNSKGVMLSHKNISHNAYVGIDICFAAENSRFLSVLPLAHSYECTLGLIIPMMSGSSIHYIKGAPTARVMIQALNVVRPQQMLTVPILIEKIYRTSIAPKFASKKILRFLYSQRPTKFLLNRYVAGKKLKALFGGRLEFFGIGGAPLAPDVEVFLRDARFPYSVGYGLTETAPCLAGDIPSRSVYRAIGKAFKDVELRIADVRPETGHGEIQARGPNIMIGYYKDEEKTAEVFTEDGWFKTGDLGYLDEKNILFIKGRLKNMILGANGENIYPEEIEAILNRDPYVLDSLVSRIGNSLVARVQLNTEKLDEFLKGLKKTPEELNRIKTDTLEMVRQSANNSLNALSRLGKIIEQVEPFEKTPSLKIKRFLYSREDRKSGQSIE